MKDSIGDSICHLHDKRKTCGLYGADEKLTMNVRILLVQGTIVLRIRNGGAEFNPVAYYEQRKVNVVEDNIDAMLALDDSLGIKMICDTADVVDYRRTFGVNNLSIII